VDEVPPARMPRSLGGSLGPGLTDAVILRPLERFEGAR